MLLDTLQNKTIEWSKERRIIQNSTLQAQGLKLMSEMGELSDNIVKGNDIKDDIGDCLVVLCNLAAMSGTDLNKCWEIAYREIKDRKGILAKSGAFIKESDPAYLQATKEDWK